MVWYDNLRELQIVQFINLHYEFYLLNSRKKQACTNTEI